jgi:hypothetical protein
MQLDLNSRITVNTAERDAVYPSLVSSAEGRAAGPTKAKTPAGTGFVVPEILLTACPREGVGLDF